MIHGVVSGSHVSWRLTCAKDLAPQRRVLLYDLRGHGFSERPTTGYRMADMLFDLERIGGVAEPVSLVGHSYGALIAARAAAKWPQAVQRIVMVDPPIGGDVQRPLDAERRSPAARRRHPVPLSDTTLTRDVTSDPPVTVAELVGLACPVHVVFGDASPFAASADAVRAGLGADNVSVFPGGHGIHVDATEDVSQLLQRLLPPSEQEPDGTIVGA